MYQDPRIVKRKKGQRFDKQLLGTTAQPLDNAEAQSSPYCGVPAGATVKELGTFAGFDGYGADQVYQALEVTLANGTVVPCYRMYVVDNGVVSNYMACQNYGWKAYVVKGKWHDGL